MFWLGVAAAAGSNVVPGDWFYDVKRAAERPAQLFDGDIVATNRVGELEELISRGAGPAVVATARTDAVDAVVDRGPDDDLRRLVTWLAWPGPPADDDASDVTVIPAATWRVDGGYRAALADGHLVTISIVGGEVLIAATGPWASVTTVEGWELIVADRAAVYRIERRGDDLVVRITAGRSDPGLGEARGGLDPDAGQAAPSLSEDSAPTSAVGPTTTRSSSGSSAGAATTEAWGRSTATTPPGSTSTTERSAATTTRSTTARSTTRRSTTTATTSRVTTTTSAGGTTTETTRPRPTTTTTPPTTSTTVPQATPWVGYLLNPGTGDTASSPVLPLSVGPAPTGPLANFDTDRDGDAGLMIKKDGAGLSTGDRTKYQEWRWTANDPTAVDGQVALTIWLAAKDFAPDERIGVQVSLELCSPGCVRVGTGQWSGPGQNGFAPATISIGSMARTIPAGAELRLRAVVPDGLATTDVWLAYDAAAFTSRIRVG